MFRGGNCVRLLVFGLCTHKRVAVAVVTVQMSRV